MKTYPKTCLKNNRRTLPAICANCARSCKYAGRAKAKKNLQKEREGQQWTEK
jgi:hypothetical protein